MNEKEVLGWKGFFFLKGVETLKNGK